MFRPVTSNELLVELEREEVTADNTEVPDEETTDVTTEDFCGDDPIASVLGGGESSSSVS